VIVIFARGKDANALWEYARMRRWDEHDNIAAMGQLEELISVVHSGKVAIVMMSSVKGLVPELLAVLREFAQRGIRLIIPNFRIDTSKISHKALLEFLDRISEFHHTVTAASISAGLAQARERGVRLGRPHSVNPHHDDVVKLRAQGFSGRKIAKALDVPSSTVFKILRG
jgi:DNA invertase Pin-like site-specific DNA recombinase